MIRICKYVATILLFVGLTQHSLFAQTIEDRITAIIANMTIEEKILQLHAEGGFNTADNARLNIPGFIMADGPHGVREGTATSFPVGIGMAATWDVELAYRVGIAMGKEFRGKGKHQALGPCLDIDRDPRNGRSPETGGEDSYLCAQITTAVAKGIQTTPTIATIKHFNANHRENGRTQNNITAGQKALHEEVGLAFRTAVQQGGVFSVMNAYNQINSEKCAENHNLLTTILRDHWGFPFYVVSDWGSIWSAERAIEAGCDVDMGSDDYKNNLPTLVANGSVSVATIDEAVRRVLRTKILAGMLDYQPPGDPADVNSPEHRQLCLEAGRKSLVLLKNAENLLPLSINATGKIALIGPSAAIAQTDGAGSSYVTPLYSVSLKQALEFKLGSGKVVYEKGCNINSSDTSRFSAAVSVAKSSDVVIFCGGLDLTQEGEGLDRVGESIQLPGKQQDLINALAAANKNVIVVLFSGGICGVGRCIDNIRSLLYAFYPGQESGTALAEVLFGDYNPGGKLPVTMPQRDTQLPGWLANDDFNYGYGRGYRWFDKKGYVPQFTFGTGLSYTTFACSHLDVFPSTVAPGEPVTVTLDVTNTGIRTGEEVVQLYLSDSSSFMFNPIKQLKGFKRVSLTPGQTQRVTLEITADEMYTYNETTSTYEVQPSLYTIRIGESSDNLPLTGNFIVTDGPCKPDLLITNVKMAPPYPVPGQKVVFLAMVKNQGSTATAAGKSLKIVFSVDGKQISYSDEFTGSIPSGGMALVCGNKGVDSVNYWVASNTGDYTITASVDPDQSVTECVETNNSKTATLKVYPKPLVNQALGRAVNVSSIEKAGLEGENAVDGNKSTRWASAFSDPQYITVDLGAMFTISDVVLYWETAYAKEYQIQISDGIGLWVPVYHETTGDGGMDKISVNAKGRFVRMVGLQRATEWGYSLFEFEVYGTPSTDVQHEEPLHIPSLFALRNCYPNPFNPTTTLQFTVSERGAARVRVFDLLGKQVSTLFNEIAETNKEYTVYFNASAFPSGMYLAVLESGTKRATQRLMLIK
jgi:beta-glucosidase